MVSSLSSDQKKKKYGQYDILQFEWKCVLRTFEVSWNNQYFINRDKWGVKMIVIKFPFNHSQLAIMNKYIPHMSLL